MVRKYFLGWFGLLAIAMLNGFLREFFYTPYVGNLLAHQISVFTGIMPFLFGSLRHAGLLYLHVKRGSLDVFGWL
jgi:hypothetical protein